MLSACDDEQEYVSETVTRCSIDVTASFSGIDSRAIFTEEQEKAGVKNYCFMLYNGTGLDAQLIKLIDIDLTKVVMPYYTELPQPVAGQKWFAVMLGNVSGSQLGDAGLTDTSTLADLFSATYDINTTDNNPTSPEKFTWSGYKYLQSGDRQITFHLNPNVAKIAVNVINKASTTDAPLNKIKLINIQVKNIPSKARFAQNALSKANLFTHTDNATGVDDYIDYEIESLELSNGQQTSSPFEWYMPHNEAGKGVRSVNNPGNADIPANASYIAVDGIRGVDWLDTEYKVYPSCNEYKADGSAKLYSELDSFNVKCDHQYTITVSISDDGVNFDTTDEINNPDHSGDVVDRVILPGETNCYMIHPMYSNSANPLETVNEENPSLGYVNNTTIYEMPISRVNEYWGNSWGISGIGDVANVIDENTSWRVEVIWQDIKGRAMWFTNESGTTDTDYYYGTGNAPVYFKLDRKKLEGTDILKTPAAEDIYGNILVGLKKVVNGEAQDGYLWSWHLWLTDYLPDAAPEYAFWNNTFSVQDTKKFYMENSDTYPIDRQGTTVYNTETAAYDKKGVYGNVQHFYLFDSYYDPTVGTCTKIWTQSESNEVWDRGGIYGNKWIMDRNLGSQGPSNFDIKEPCNAFGPYYQFGRKDPFPFYKDVTGDGVADGFKLYKIDGSASFTMPAAKGEHVTMNVAVNNPTTRYLRTGTSRSWTSNYNTNPWYSPVAPDGDGKKTIFDPCPAGWCLPKKDAYHFAMTNQNGNGNSRYAYDNTKKTYNSIVYHTTAEGYMDVYASSLSARDNFRHFSIIRYHETYALYTANAVDFYIPTQGLMEAYSDVITFPTGTAPDTRAYLWTCNVDNSSTGGFGMGIGHSTGAYDYGLYRATNGQPIAGRYRYIYCNAGYLDQFSSAYGLNSRCIQEPD